jgi:positive regulator of sigma E activity
VIVGQIVGHGQVRSAFQERLVLCRSTAPAERCGSCHSLESCGATVAALVRRSKSTEVICADRERDALQVGDAVEICLPPDRLLLAASATYGLLLAFVMGSVAIVESATGLDSDTFSAAACALGFAMGLLAMRRIDTRHGAWFVPRARRAVGRTKAPFVPV